MRYFLRDGWTNVKATVIQPFVSTGKLFMCSTSSIIIFLKANPTHVHEAKSGTLKGLRFTLIC